MMIFPLLTDDDPSSAAPNTPSSILRHVLRHVLRRVLHVLVPHVLVPHVSPKGARCVGSDAGR